MRKRKGEPGHANLNNIPGLHCRRVMLVSIWQYCIVSHIMELQFVNSNQNHNPDVFKYCILCVILSNKIINFYILCFMSSFINTVSTLS